MGSIQLLKGHWSLKLFPRWVGAWTLGTNIYFREENPHPDLVMHELGHVNQYKRYGIAGFLARYLWLSIRYGYKNNPLELEARNYGHKIFQYRQ
jgi:hypothetical protein